MAALLGCGDGAQKVVAAVQHAAHVHAGRHAHGPCTVRVAAALAGPAVGGLRAASRAPRYPLHVRVAHDLCTSLRSLGERINDWYASVVEIDDSNPCGSMYI